MSALYTIQLCAIYKEYLKYRY